MRWLKQLFSRRRRCDELSESIREHLAEKIADLMDRGMAQEQAEQAARREFGNVTRIEERSREEWQWPTLEGIFRDAHHAFRSLAKAPAFTATAVLTLALGIGATTAIFTLVNAVLLRSLPVRNPGELWRIGDNEQCCFSSGLPGSYSTPNDWSLFSYEQYREFREHTPGFENLAAFSASPDQLAIRRAGNREPVEPYSGEWVSGNAFDTLGLQAYAGRLLQASDDVKGAAPVAVMSYETWEQKFGRDSAVIGASLSVDGQPVTVVGITPPTFYGERLSPTPPSFWLPLATMSLLSPADNSLDHPEVQWLNLIGRIAPGVSVATIQAQMEVELQQFLNSPLSKITGPVRSLIPKQYLRLTPGGGGVQRMQEEYRANLQLLMWISAFVLLIACANLANLMLARSVTQRQQVSVRTALGAPRQRLVQRALVECLLLSMLGGLTGLLFAWGGAKLILHLAFRESPVNISAHPSIAVLGFAFGASLLTGLLFGVVPAWMAAHANPIDALRGANRATGRSTIWTQKTLVVAQTAISVILLCAAGFLILSLNRLQHQHFGFQTAHRTVLMIDPQDAGYQSNQLDAFYQQLHDSLERIPGVSNVAWSLWSPMDGRNRSQQIYVEGQPTPPPGSQEGYVSWNRVSPAYFDATGTRLVEGRSILESDDRTSRNVAVVNETFVRDILHGKNPIGVHFGDFNPSVTGTYEVVGVVEDTQYWNPGTPIRPMYFVPAAQWPQLPPSTPQGADYEKFIANTHYMWSIELETHGTVPGLQAQVLRALAEVNPNLMMVHYQSFAGQVSLAFSQQNMIVQLTSLFGSLALVLAAIGLYGVMAYEVAQRTSEIGIRMALGANRGNVQRMMLRGAFLQVGLGLLLGIPAAIFMGHLMASQLFGVTNYSPLVLGATILALSTAAFAAAVVPARRAASIDPMQALRSE